MSTKMTIFGGECEFDQKFDFLKIGDIVHMRGGSGFQFPEVDISNVCLKETYLGLRTTDICTVVGFVKSDFSNEKFPYDGIILFISRSYRYIFAKPRAFQKISSFLI